MGCEGCQFHRTYEETDNKSTIPASVLDGCTKLGSSDWMKDLDNEPAPAVAEVRFKNTRKEFFSNSGKLRIKTGDIVAVEAEKGHDIGIISLAGNIAFLQYAKKFSGQKPNGLPKLYRTARSHDLELWKEAKELEEPTLIKARQIAGDMGLSMKIGDVEYQGDKTTATFYYTAENRIDYRELIKVYARQFRIRIVMRQIGLRQEAGMIGGIGSCGRELCCSTWRTNLDSVPMEAARKQNLNPMLEKLTGQCGKLKCCLMYELEVYLDAMQDFPTELLELETKKGTAFPGRIDTLKKIVWYSYDPGTESNSYPLDLDRIRKVIMMNKKGQHPEELIET